MSKKVNEKWTAKRVIKEIITTLLMLFVISMGLNYLRQPEINEHIYDYERSDIKEHKINFNDYKGKPLVVHFWGTWCPTCKLEASNIEVISSKHNVVSIAVNSGSNETIDLFMKEHDLSYRVINDAEGTLAKKFNIEVYPTTLIYNSKGVLKFTEVGYSTSLGLKARLGLID